MTYEQGLLGAIGAFAVLVLGFVTGVLLDLYDQSRKRKD